MLVIAIVIAALCLSGAILSLRLGEPVLCQDCGLAHRTHNEQGHCCPDFQAEYGSWDPAS